MKESSLPQKAAETTAAPSAPVDRAYTDDHFYAKLFPYYDIQGAKTEDPEVKQRLQFIWDYFSKDAEDTASVLWKIRQMENSLGSPEFGTTRFEQLYRYLKIRGQEDSVREQREALEKGKIEQSSQAAERV